MPLYDTIPRADAGFYKLAQIDLGSSQASIDIASIPATYRHLRLFTQIRTDAATTADVINLALNNDTTAANYDREFVQGAANTASATEGLTSRVVGASPGASSPASHFGTLEITIMNYSSTSFYKIAQVTMSCWSSRSSGGLIVRQMVTAWANTAAVNRITLTSNTGGALFVAGSAASLYGLKDAT